ncbi:MAG TPA: glycosyltransferase family 39 protein [Gaiellaceae bacterium]|nr:glycosyltransferase family 39 protein [Gaiellaceae bacterium]
MPRRGPDRALLVLGAVVVGSTLVRSALSHGVDAPWIAPDEQLYGLLGRSLVSGDGLTLLGEPIPYYSLLYPLLVGLPLAWGDPHETVRAVQLVQALVMSLTAVPAYLWARPLAGRRWALVAAALTVLIPGLVYSGLLMSEALYYPVATLAVWALAECLRHPTLLRQALLLAAVGLALGTRLQAVGLAATILAALGLLSLAERSLILVRRFWPTLAVLAAGGVVWAVSRIRAGGVGELLGAYAPLAQADEYSLADVAQSLAWQTGAVTLITVGVPLVALGVLAWETVRGAERDPGVRVLVASALAYTAVTLVEVGAFASRFVEHVTERQLLSVAPPIFVAFAVWLRRGAPRPQPVTSVVALAVAATALLLPLDRVATLAAYADAPSMIPLEQLSRHLGTTAFEGLYAGALAMLLLAAVLVPRRAAATLSVVIALALGGGSLVASLEIRDGSRVERERTFAGAPVDWIDAGGGHDVALLLTGERFWPSAWEILFWNDSITKVVRLRGVESPGVMPQEVVTARADGRLLTRLGAELEPLAVAAPTGVSIVGDEVASLPGSFEQPGMTLWRVDPPLRLSRRIVGLRPNGDLHGEERALVRVFGCGSGRLELTLLGKQGLPTRVLLGGQVVAQRAIPPEEVWRPSIPAPPSADGSGICDFRVETDGLVGSTRIEFVRDG